MSRDSGSDLLHLSDNSPPGVAEYAAVAGLCNFGTNAECDYLIKVSRDGEVEYLLVNVFAFITFTKATTCWCH